MSDVYRGATGLQQPGWLAHVKQCVSWLRGNLLGSERDRLLDRIRYLESEVSHWSKLAITDELTGAFNRRHIDDVFKEHLLLQRCSESLAFCLFDVDNFKAYNDSYGHGAGDEALRLVAQTVRGKLRHSCDSLFRLGGDEFCILLCAPSPTEAMHVVERIRLAVRELALPHPFDRNQVLTASFGLVWRCDRSPLRLVPRELYLNADRMLYDAKRAGRDQVKLAVL